MLNCWKVFSQNIICQLFRSSHGALKLECLDFLLLFFFETIQRMGQQWDNRWGKQTPTAVSSPQITCVQGPTQQHESEFYRLKNWQKFPPGSIFKISLKVIKIVIISVIPFIVKFDYQYCFQMSILQQHAQQMAVDASSPPGSVEALKIRWWAGQTTGS